MNFYFPDKRALCMAENATHNLHNLLTLRGAQVRDPRIWSRYLAEAIELFARQSDVAFASHHWPTWGTDGLVTYMAQQRDLYAYLHDQTLRLINQGSVYSEIAEAMELAPELDRAWHARGSQSTCWWLAGRAACGSPGEPALRQVRKWPRPGRWSDQAATRHRAPPGVSADYPRPGHLTG
jgi:alkyl sulfatase BDS1-like metallo-beta-lactamase superfamily hydrolase